MLASQIVILFTSNNLALVDLFSRMCWPFNLHSRGGHIGVASASGTSLPRSP